MHRELWKYCFSFLLVCLLVVTAIFLPQAYSRLWDGKYQEQVTLFSREQSLISHEYDTSIEQKVKILTQQEEKGEALRPVRQTRENVISEEKLVEKLTEQLKEKELESIEMFLKVSSYDLKDMLQSAQLYSVKDESGGDAAGDSVLFWCLEFDKEDGVYGIFCVDAYTYTLYSASVLWKNTSSTGAMVEGTDGIGGTDEQVAADVYPDVVSKDMYEEAYFNLSLYGEYLKLEALGGINGQGMDFYGLDMRGVLGNTTFGIRSSIMPDSDGIWQKVGIRAVLDWSDTVAKKEK